MTNIVTVLGEFVDPKLPARDVDVVLFHDVLHHIENRAGYLKAAAGYLKPNGRIAVVELPPDGSHKDEPALVVTKDQVKQWMADAGLKPVQEFDGLEGKWFVVYSSNARRTCGTGLAPGPLTPQSSSPDSSAPTPAAVPRRASAAADGRRPPAPFRDRASRFAGVRWRVRW